MQVAIVTHRSVSSTVGVASVGLVVQACPWESVCVPKRLAAAPLGTKARTHGHSVFTVLVRSHCGIRLLREKDKSKGKLQITELHINTHNVAFGKHIDIFYFILLQKMKEYWKVNEAGTLYWGTVTLQRTRERWAASLANEVYL